MFKSLKQIAIIIRFEKRRKARISIYKKNLKYNIA